MPLSPDLGAVGAEDPQLDPNFVSLEEVTTPIDVALRRAGERLGSDLTTTGGSGRGWSYHRTLLQCPYKYYRTYVQPLPKERAPVVPESKRRGMSIGSVAHALRAFHRTNVIEDLNEVAPERRHAEPLALRDALLEEGANAEIVAEAWRVFQCWLAWWDSVGEPFIPLAVEEWAKDRGGADTCRYDEIALVRDPRSGLEPGIWIVEAKFVSRNSEENRSGWHLDGEILQQVGLWNRSGMRRKWGPLQGLAVDVTVRKKEPECFRIEISPAGLAKQVRRQRRDLRQWRALRDFFAASGTWPRNLSSCIERYGFCKFWSHCRE